MGEIYDTLAGNEGIVQKVKVERTWLDPHNVWLLGKRLYWVDLEQQLFRRIVPKRARKPLFDQLHGKNGGLAGTHRLGALLKQTYFLTKND